MRLCRLYVCAWFRVILRELWEELIWIHTCVRLCVCVRKRLSVRMLVPLCVLTFVVGGVVDAEISVPDDGQLHGKTAHLHPIIEILSPWQPERGIGRDGEESMRERSC